MEGMFTSCPLEDLKDDGNDFVSVINLMDIEGIIHDSGETCLHTMPYHSIGM